MRVGTGIGGWLDSVPAAAKQAEAQGYDYLTCGELAHDSILTMTVAGTALTLWPTMLRTRPRMEMPAILSSSSMIHCRPAGTDPDQRLPESDRGGPEATGVTGSRRSRGPIRRRPRSSRPRRT